MDKFKEKLNTLRIEAETATARAIDAEQQCKKLQEALQCKENEILSWQNKATLLTQELERAEERIVQVKVQRQENDAAQSQSESFTRKIALLENDLEVAQRNYKDCSEKVRNLELISEQSERRAARLEAEKNELESKLDDINQKYIVVKKELDDTLKSISEL